MPLTTYTAGQVLTAASLNANLSFAASNPTGGLSLITTASPSAAASVSIDNCFTSTYENYKIVVNLRNSNASNQLKFNLRASATNNTTANYAFIGSGYSSAGTLDNFQAEGGTFWEAGYCDAASIGFYADFTIFSPQTAIRTTMSGGSMKGISATRIANRFYGMTFNATTQFDGFTLTSDVGTITGTVRVYGFLNS